LWPEGGHRSLGAAREELSFMTVPLESDAETQGQMGNQWRGLGGVTLAGFQLASFST
jgi:hypothetical protein